MLIVECLLRILVKIKYFFEILLKFLLDYFDNVLVINLLKEFVFY